LPSFIAPYVLFFNFSYGIISPEVVFVSDYQEEGRGRGKNSWSSPLGGLYFSFNCTCREAKNLPFIQYVICLAVIEVRYGESEQDNFMLMT